MRKEILSEERLYKNDFDVKNIKERIINYYENLKI